MINSAELTFSQQLAGVALTLMMLMFLTVPIFYLLAHIFPEKLEFIGRVYKLYKICGTILIGGLMLWAMTV